MESLLYEIQKLINEIKDKIDDDIKIKIKYQVLSVLFNDLKKINTESELRTYLSRINIEVIRFEEEYNRNLDKYKKDKESSVDRKTLNNEVRELNILAAQIDSYNKVINNINKFLKSLVKETPKETKRNISDEIIEKLEKYNKMDKKTSEAKKLNLQIFNLREQREQEIKSKVGYDGVKILFEIESLEEVASRSNKEKDEDYSLDAAGFNRQLKNLIYAYNEYYFLDKRLPFFVGQTNYKYDNNKTDGQNEVSFKKKFNIINRRLKNMIVSLFGSEEVEINVNGNKISFNDFLSYLTRYNILGGYTLFEVKNKERKLGNEDINKKMFDDNNRLVIDTMNELCKMCLSKIGNSTIKIEDHQKVQSDYKKEIELKYKELQLLLSKKLMEGRGVHR